MNSETYPERFILAAKVFQAKVVVICEAAKSIALLELSWSMIVLYSDSRAALLPIPNQQEDIADHNGIDLQIYVISST